MADNEQDAETADCQEAVQRLYDFLDGELTPERRVVIQRHLDACHDCIEAFEFEAELKLAISRGCRDVVPESLRIRVFQAIISDQTP